MNNQYGFDKLAFAKLVSDFTGISVSKLDSFIESNSTEMVFEHPTAIGITQQQLKKLEQLKELSSLYNNLKGHKAVYSIKSSMAAGEYFTNYFSGVKDKEKFVCTFLDTANNIMATEVMNTGTINETPVYPREIIKRALLYDANSIMISHNHPGGSLNLSSDDIKLTKNIYQAASAVKIKLLDHIIVAGEQYCSFMERGIMPEIETNLLKSSGSHNDIAEDEETEM